MCWVFSIDHKVKEYKHFKKILQVQIWVNFSVKIGGKDFRDNKTPVNATGEYSTVSNSFSFLFEGSNEKQDYLNCSQILRNITFSNQ